MLSLYDLAEVGAAITALFSMLFVLVRKQQHVSAHTYVVTAFITFLFWVGFLAFVPRHYLGSLSHAALASGLILSSQTCLLFLFTFARATPFRTLRGWKLPAYGTIAASTVAIVVSFFIKYFDFDFTADGTRYFTINPSGKWLLILLIIIYALGLLQLEGTFRSSTGRVRRALLLPIIVFAVFLSAMLINASLGLLYTQIHFVSIQICALLSIASMILVSRFLVFKETQAERVVVSREAVYSSVGVLMVGVYLVLIGSAVKLLVSLGASLNVFFSVLAAFVVIIVFLALLFSGSIKQRMRRFVDRSVYSGKIDLLGELTSFAEDVTAAVDKKDMFTVVVTILEVKCGLSDVEILLKGNKNGEFIVNYPSDINGQYNLPQLEDWLFRIGRITPVREISDQLRTISDLEKDFFQKRKEHFFIPLIARKELVGFIVCAWQDEPNSDIEFLVNSISHQLALSLLSAKQSEFLIENREMASFNKVSSFVIHDVKNLISMISMIVQNAENKFDDHRFQKMTIETLQGAQERMKRMINRLTAPDKEIDFEIGSCNLKEIVLNLKNDMKLTNNRKIDLEIDLPITARVKGNTDKIKSIISNLLLNAMEAMPTGGTLAIAAVETKQDVLLKVTDSGIGMSVEFIKDKLFHPFKTTKKSGLGIGLFQSKELAEQMNGNLTAESQIGEGSCFTLKLKKYE